MSCLTYLQSTGWISARSLRSGTKSSPTLDIVSESSGMPYYSTKTPIKVNTIFNTNLGPRSRQFTTGVPRVKIETDNRLLRNTRVGEKRSEFITSPPISVIKLKVFVYTPPMRPPYPPGSLQYVCSATLRTATPLSKRPEGIRVGDLLDCLEKVAAYARKKGWVWHGLAQSKDLSSSLTRRWKVVQLGKVKNGIDVRKPRRVEGRSYCFSGSGSYSGSDSGTDSDSDIDVD
jgi:hypothetical protein